MSKQVTTEDAATLARREYQRKWRKKNADKIKKYNQAYWAKVAARTEAANDENENDTRSK